MSKDKKVQARILITLNGAFVKINRKKGPVIQLYSRDITKPMSKKTIEEHIKNNLNFEYGQKISKFKYVKTMIIKSHDWAKK